MKNNILYFIITFFAFGFIACEKNLLDKNIQWQYADVTKANLKIVNAYTSNVPVGATGVGVTRFFVYQNQTKLSGNAIAAVTVWPSTTGGYGSVEPGKSNFYLTLDRRVNNVYGAVAVGDTAFKPSLDLKAGTFYSAFLIGASPTQEVIIKEDVLTQPQKGFYKVRFANLVPDPARPITIYSRREKKNIVSGLNYKQVGDFIELPVPLISDTLDVFDATSTTALYRFNTFQPVTNKIYTFYAQGRKGFRTEALSSYNNL